MLRRRMILALPATMAAWRHPAFAQQAASGADQMAAVAQASLEGPLSEGTLSDQMEAFIESSGFGDRAARNELSVLKGSAEVKVLASNPDWVRARQLAYTAAMLDAQAEYAVQQGTQVTATTVQEFFKAADEQPPPYDDTKTPGQAAEVIRKLMAVAGGKLDQALQGLGIDPRQYEAAPEAQRTTLLKDRLKSSMLKRSLASTVGLCPVMTFEEIQNGVTSIGVVAVVSAQMRDFAQQVLVAQGAFDPAPGRAQDLRKLVADKNQLIRDFGVRRLFDAQGLPVIVSFAQWGTAYRGNDPIMAATYRRHASEQARNLADGQIADFLKGAVDYSNNSSVGQDMDRIAVSLPDSGRVEDTMKILDEARKLIVRRAEIRITGLRTQGTWSAKHPVTDADIVGVIRIWSAGGERMIREQQAVRPQAGPGSPQANGSGSGQGRSLMNAADF